MKLFINQKDQAVTTTFIYTVYKKYAWNQLFLKATNTASSGTVTPVFCMDTE